MLYEAAEECGYVNSTKVGEILDINSQDTAKEKKTKDPPSKLAPRQVARLAAAIPANKMTYIAEGYLDIDDKTISKAKVENEDDTDAFVRQLIKHWMHKNPDDQVQVITLNILLVSSIKFFREFSG